MSDFGNLVEISDDILDQDQKIQRALMKLLDQQREKREHLLALRTKMGATTSYVASVPLEWVAEKVKFATELPIFREHKDPKTGQIVVDEETAAMIQQRVPDWSRQLPMAMYLAARPTHKFPPILVVVTQSWVDEPRADEWSNERALRDSITARNLDSLGDYADVHLNASRDFMYAIDGQHRLMAIQGLRDLITQGHLYARNKEGKPSARRYTIDDVIDASHGRLTRTSLQQLLGEHIGVELIPAVQKNETRVEALRRLRSIFVHVNKTAKPLTQGEIALLDEDNGFAVVARSLMAAQPLLKNRVQVKKGQLNATAPEVTTLETLVTMTTEYLQPKFPTWKPRLGREEIPIRPDEASIDEGIQLMKDLIDMLGKLDTFRDIMQGGAVRDYREPGQESPAHFLLRPMGQIALAQAMAVLVHERGRTADDIGDALCKQDKKRAFKCDDPATPWYGSAWDPVKMGMQRSAGNQNLCFRLFLHLLDNGTPDKETRDSLREDFRTARVIDPDNEIAVDFQGGRVKKDKIDLPNPW